jgi:hypothetical protein
VEDRLDWALRNAGFAIDALVRVDIEHLLALVEALHGAHHHAIGVLAAEAGFGNDMSHGLFSPFGVIGNPFGVNGNAVASTGDADRGTRALERSLPLEPAVRCLRVARGALQDKRLAAGTATFERAASNVCLASRAVKKFGVSSA